MGYKVFEDCVKLTVGYFQRMWVKVRLLPGGCLERLRQTQELRLSQLRKKGGTL